MSFLPLNLLRSIGALVGIIGIKFSKRARLRLRNNLLITNLANNNNIDSLMSKTAKELGKTLIETVSVAWFRSKKHNASLIKNWYGLDLVLEMEKQNRPLVFLTPHIGNFEVAIKAVLHKIKTPITILYKPSKNKWFNELMLRGRSDTNIKPVPTNKAGVIALVKALKRDEAIGILPDSVASQGEGEWVKFFGCDVFATTLASKMAMFYNAVTFIVGSYRVKGGFNIEFIPYYRQDNIAKVQDIYAIIEKIILKAPTQYFWSYDRFRIPDHAK